MNIKSRQYGETGKAYALRIIKDNIVNLELEPGKTISANDLALEIGVSKTHVREALIELNQIGIVDIYPQSGSRVALVDCNMVEESRFMRLTLECGVLHQLCENVKAPILLQLEDNMKLQQFYLENHMYEEFQEMDNDFHRILFRGASKMHVYDIMCNFAIHFDRIRRIRLISDKDVNVVSDHRIIINAISSGDTDKAVHQMELHLSRYQVDEEELKKMYSSYFK